MSSLKVSLKYPLILLNELGLFPGTGRTFILLLGNPGNFSGWGFSKGAFPSGRSGNVGEIQGKSNKLKSPLWKRELK